MALATAVANSQYTNAAASAYTTTSFNVVAGRLYVAYLLHYRMDSITPVAPAYFSGLGITWVGHQFHTWDVGGTGRAASTMYSGVAPANASGTLTFQMNDTCAGANWCVIEVTGVDTASPVVQSGAYNSPGANDVSGSLALGAFANAQNMNLSFCCNGQGAGGGVAPAIGAPFSTIVNVNDAPRLVGFNGATAVNTTTVSCTSAASRIGITSMEIRNLGLVSRSMAGSITPSGSLRRFISKRWAGAITPIGAHLTRLVKARSMGGGITPTGALTRAAFIVYQKAVGGSITPTGTVARQWFGITYRTFTGRITPSGTLGVLWSGISFVVLSGRITPIGGLVPQYLKRLLIGYDESSLDFVPQDPATESADPAPEDTLDFTKLDSYDG